MVAKQTARGSMLADLFQSGASRLLFPRPRTTALEAILINTAGGVTGGDRFALTAEAGTDSRIILTTQAAERLYCALPDQTGFIETRLQVAAGARIDWLPQETIVFNGSALRRRLVAELAAGASLLLAEPLVFGRAAMGETLSLIGLSDRIEIWRDGHPLFLDAMSLQGDVSAHLAQPQIAGGAGAMALIVYVAVDADAHLDPVRALMPATAGASLIAPDLLVGRILAADSFELRQSLVPILAHLTRNALPRSWMT